MENAQSPSGMYLEFWNRNPNPLTYNKFAAKLWWIQHSCCELVHLVSWATVGREMEVVFSPCLFPSSCPSQHLAFPVLCTGVIISVLKMWKARCGSAGAEVSNGPSPCSLYMWVWFAPVQTGWWDQKLFYFFLAVLVWALSAHLASYQI